MKKKDNVNSGLVGFNEQEVRQDLLRSMKALRVPEGVAETWARKIISEVKPEVKERALLTDEQLNGYLATAAKKYSADLAYVYQNRGKII